MTQIETASREMSMDEFGDHDTGGTRGERKFLKWKDDKTGEINVWLAGLPFTLWRHSFHRVVKYTDKEDKEVEKIVMYTWNSYESEAWIKELKGQRYYAFTKAGNELDVEDIEDRKQPQYDPFWMFLEWLYKQYVLKNISWTDEVFRFVAADSKTLVLHAGGVLGMYPRNWNDVKFKSPDEEKRVKREFSNAGIELKEAFKQNSTIGCRYMFLVVDHEKPEDGIQLTIEAETLGDGIKKVFNDRKIRIAAKNPKLDKKAVADQANPVKKVCFRWEFDNSKNFKEKYNVIDLGFDEIPEEIQEAFKAELPDTSLFTRPGNVAFLENVLTTHWCHDVTPPWKEIFAPGYERARLLEKHFELKEGTLTELSTDFNHGTNETSQGSSEPKESETSSLSSSAKTKTPPLSEDAEMVKCEACGKDMPSDASICPHCKAVYVEVPIGLGEVVVTLRDQTCETCGKVWHADELKCQACGTEYGLQDEKFVVTKKPEPPKSEEKTAEVRTSARRRIAK